MNPQYVYCIVNDELANLCKCGGTKNSPQYRCDQLSNTSLPVKCNLAYFIEVNDWKIAEKYVHNKITDMGIERCKGREWFKCKPDDIITVFDECKKLYGYNGENNKKEDTENTKVAKNKKVIKSTKDAKNTKIIKVIKYHCKTCNYKTNDSSNFCRHTKQKSHLKKAEAMQDNDKIKIKLIEMENEKKLIEKEKKLIENEKKLIEKDNEKKLLEIKYDKILLEKEKEINKLYKQLDSVKINN